MKKSFDFASAMKELEEINRWFQDQEIDLDVGLEKLKRAKELIGQCRDRLKNVENEFVKIKDEFETPEERGSAPVQQEPLPPATEKRYIASNEKPAADPFADDDGLDDDDDLPF